MLFKNVASQKVHVYAYDSTTGAAKTGDAANITAYVSLDGTANAVDDTNPAEVDATNMPGIYCFDLAQAETNCNSWALYAKSSTSNIRIEPIIGFTTGAAVTQTGDSYAIVSHADYGNAKLARTGADSDTLETLSDQLDDIPTATENADALLKRDWTEITGEAARSVLNALRLLRNKWGVSGTILTVTKENDSTSAWTATVTTSESADTITGSDPD